MAIAETAGEYILEEIIRQMLDEGISLSLTEIENRYNAYVADKDLSLPLFDLNYALVEPDESSSASKWNTVYADITQDLSVSYSEVYKLTSRVTEVFDRWRQETKALESRLNDLDTRITDLLRNVKNPYVKYIADDFVDASKVDLEQTTALLDLLGQTIGLQLTTVDPTRLSLNQITDEDCSFSILTRDNILAANIAPQGELINAFDDRDSFWQTRVTTKSASKPITGELKVHISDEALNISRISIKLHTANTSSPIQITPFLSSDGVNFEQVDTVNITISTREKASWTFPATEVTDVKFLMTKLGHDYVDGSIYIYEFGAEDISFYIESYAFEESQVLISKALSVLDLDRNVIPFNSVQLRVCERIPDNTSIRYFIAALEMESDTPIWVGIDHVDKTNSLYPKVINFGNTVTRNLDSLEVSYDPAVGATPSEVNPDKDFTLIDYSFDDAGISSSVTSTDTRYYLINNSDHILNTQIIAPDLIDGSLQLFRNVGFKNSSTNDYPNQVRGTRAGWKFVEPYYQTVVKVLNANGFAINVGDKNIVLNDTPAKGKVTIPYGIHTIKVHKDNWVNIPGNLVTIEALQAEDPLFPYNHKHLIEGYGLDSPDNPYIGTELFAEYNMKQVAVSDFITSVQGTDYSKFATDFDNGAVLAGPSSMIFMVKSDKKQSDFLSETFSIYFDLKKQLYNYIKFKAELVSNDTSVSPNLDGYKLRLNRLNRG